MFGRKDWVEILETIILLVVIAGVLFITSSPVSALNLTFTYNDSPMQNYDIYNGTYTQGFLLNFSAGDIPITGFAQSLIKPFMARFGWWIFPMLWFTFLGMFWLRTGTVEVPFWIGLVTAGVFGILFPPEAVNVIIIIFAVGIAVIFYRSTMHE